MSFKEELLDTERLVFSQKMCDIALSPILSILSYMLRNMLAKFEVRFRSSCHVASTFIFSCLHMALEIRHKLLILCWTFYYFSNAKKT